MSDAPIGPASSGTNTIGGWAYLRLVLFGALIGIPAAFMAAVFLGFVHILQNWLWHDLPDALGYDSPPWYLILLVPVAGAAIVLAARLLLPGDGGHPPLDGIGFAPTPPRYAPGVALAALGTLGFGAVLGPEAPLIALGSAVGLLLNRFVRLDERESKVLGAAGSFSAISGLFGGPLVAGVLMMEGAIGMGAAALPVLLPGFVSAAVGYVIIVGFGDWGGLDVPGLAVPNLPPYQGTHVRDLVLAVVIGIATAMLVVPVKRLAAEIAVRGTTRLGMPGLLLAGGLVVGALALLADGLGANSQDVFFSGQASIPAVVAENSTKILLVLLVAKALAYAVSLGAGFRGGPVFPSIFLGVALATLAVAWFDVSPTWAVAVGAAAGTTAATGMLLTSMLFAALLVGLAGVDAVPSAVLAASAAWLTLKALDRRIGRAQPASQPSHAQA